MIVEKFGLRERDIKNLRNVFSDFGELEKAAIFGSRVLGNYTKGSDIDIALWGSELKNDEISRIRSILNQLLPIPYNIDIVHYNTIKNIELQKHIDHYGIKIYEK